VPVSASAGTSATKANERTNTVNAAVRTHLLKFWEGASVSACATRACLRLFSTVCSGRCPVHAANPIQLGAGASAGAWRASESRYR
jgi:hypothetical protein